MSRLRKEPYPGTPREQAEKDVKKAAIKLGKEVVKEEVKEKLGKVKRIFGRAALAVKEKLHVTTEGVMGNEVEALCKSEVGPVIDRVVGVLNARNKFEKMEIDELAFRATFREFLEGEIFGRKNKIHDFLKELGAFN